MGKHQWILNKSPRSLHRRFFIGPAKQQFAKDSNSVLVDDNEKKIKAFEKAGGTGILFPQSWNKSALYSGDRLKYVEDELNKLAG